MPADPSENDPFVSAVPAALRSISGSGLERSGQSDPFVSGAAVAMEYLDGESLLAILRRGVEGERLDPLSTARVIADTAEGLEAAHRLKSLDGKPLGLIHHDVSLGNIVVLYNGQVKLVDFGVAKARAHSSGKQELVQGKFGYTAPEKLKEGAEVDRR